jgi:hypothetical protein
MILGTTILLSLLTLAALALAYEAQTGRWEGRAAWRDTVRVGLFFAAGIAGSALIIRSASASMLLAAALLPVTVLCVMRLAMLTRSQWRSPARRLSMVIALVTGLFLCLEIVPEPLDRSFLIEQVLRIDTGNFLPDSIDPDSRRLVRT